MLNNPKGIFVIRITKLLNKLNSRWFIYLEIVR